ncbi:MAG: FtsQ-type POTRA domain-containing protein, partial [Candidatus Marinimicrobia bacterium]|nr:FtsQ-type POTRA domain-containing protein [Candidatus Neomarinimicrobiota bacterium]
MARKQIYKIPLLSWLFSAGLLLVMLSLSALSLGYANFLQADAVKTIELYGQRTMSPERVKRLTDAYLGQPLHALDVARIQESFLEYPLIRNAKVSREYPNKLNIYLYDVLPVAYFILDGKFYTLDEKTTLLPLPDKGMLYNLPIITGAQMDARSTNIGEALQDETVTMLVDYLKILRKEHQGIYLDISEISYDKRGIRLISAEHGTTVLVGSEEDAHLSTKILAQFISGDSEAGIISPYDYIDLRYDRQ